MVDIDEKDPIDALSQDEDDVVIEVLEDEDIGEATIRDLLIERAKLRREQEQSQKSNLIEIRKKREEQLKQVQEKRKKQESQVKRNRARNSVMESQQSIKKALGHLKTAVDSLHSVDRLYESKEHKKAIRILQEAIREIQGVYQDKRLTSDGENDQ
jgi:hypothetical protein